MREQGGKPTHRIARHNAEVMTKTQAHERLPDSSEEVARVKYETTQYQGPDYIAAFARGEKVSINPLTTISTPCCHRLHLRQTVSPNPLVQAVEEKSGPYSGPYGRGRDY